MQFLTSRGRTAWHVSAFAIASFPSFAWAQNLVQNPHFESGITGWTAISNGPQVVNYGTTNAPSTLVASKIIGEGRVLRDVVGNGIVEQYVPLATVASGSNLRAGGYFGGGDSDQARLVIRFLDSANGEIIRTELDWVGPGTRNNEFVLMRRERIITIPAGAVTAAVRIEMQNLGSSTSTAAADNILLEPTTDSLTPPPVPMGVELLRNPSFESGWIPGSPISLTELNAWEGVSYGPVIVKPYSDSDTSAPPTIVSCLIGGGTPGFSCVPGGFGNVIADSSSGNAVLKQRIDVRGNTPQFASHNSVAVLFSGHFGGYWFEGDHCRADVQFIDSSGLAFSTPGGFGAVSANERNNQTLLMKRSKEYLIPPGTCYIDLYVSFVNQSSSATHGLADLFSAKLISPSTITPAPTNVNFATNPSFENVSIYDSPIEIDIEQSWYGVNSTVGVKAYGSGNTVPDATFGASNGLGGLLLGDKGGNGAIQRYFDVRGNASLINIGRLKLYLEAWLGGYGFETDYAFVQVRFLTAAGQQVPGPGGLTGLTEVTATDRGNVTKLIPRTKEVLIPANTAWIEFTLLFINLASSTPYGLADGIRVVLFDTLTGGPVQYPGSKEDLRLFTGVNETPTTGPGYDVKNARTNDVLQFRVDSPNNTFSFVPMVLAANVYPTSGPKPQPPASLPSLAFDPFQMIFLLDGYFCGGFGCASVLPGGTQLNVFVPPGMIGNSIVVQALAIPLPSVGPIPINGLFAATEGHIINIVP